MAKDFDELDDQGWDEFQKGIDGDSGKPDDPLEAYEKHERKDLEQAAETWKAAERTAKAQRDAERLKLENTKAVAEVNREYRKHSEKLSEDINKTMSGLDAVQVKTDKLFVVGGLCFLAGIGIGYLLARRGDR